MPDGWVGHPSDGPQGAVGEGVAAVGDVLEFEPLADGRVVDDVLADDVAAADCVESDLALLAGRMAGPPAVDGRLLQVPAGSLGDLLGDLQRGARRRVLLEPMVGLQDLDVVGRAQRPGQFRRHVKQDVHAHAHVRGHEHRDGVGGRLDALPLLVRETGRSDDARHPGLGARLDPLDRPVGQREVDQRVGVTGQGVRDLDLQRAHAGQRARIGADGFVAGPFQRSDQAQVVRLGNQADQCASHPSGGAGNGNLDHGDLLAMNVRWPSRERGFAGAFYWQSGHRAAGQHTRHGEATGRARRVGTPAAHQRALPG